MSGIADLPPTLRRFDVTVDGCWEWNGARTDRGYGQSSGPVARAHRAVYEHLVGPIEARLDLDHLCRNRACVNPAHLEPVTHAENMRRADVWGDYWNRTHCPARGHDLSLAGIRTWVNKNGYTVNECVMCRRETTRRYRARQKEMA